VVQEETFTDEPAVSIEPLEDRYEQVEFYPVVEGYAYVRIVSDREAHEQTYNVIEPQLSREERDMLNFIERVITKGINVPLEAFVKKESRRYLLNSFNMVISDYNLKISPVSRKNYFTMWRGISLVLAR